MVAKIHLLFIMLSLAFISHAQELDSVSMARIIRDSFDPSKVKSAYTIWQGDTVNYIDNLGRKQGRYIEIYENVQLAYEGDFKDNLEVGIHKYYFENGIVRLEVPYTSGKINGIFRYYYENGKLKSEQQVVNEVQTGFHKIYYETGELFMKGNYQNDKEEGEFVYYNQDSTIKNTILYKHGEIINEAKTQNN